MQGDDVRLANKPLQPTRAAQPNGKTGGLASRPARLSAGVSVREMGERMRPLPFLLIACLFPVPVFAEVMDKEPTAAAVWAMSGVAATVLLLLSSTTRTVAWAMAALGLLLAYFWTSEVRDPYVGPAIVNEAGSVYIIQVYFAALVIGAAPLIGNLIRIRRERRDSKTPLAGESGNAAN